MIIFKVSINILEKGLFDFSVFFVYIGFLGLGYFFFFLIYICKYEFIYFILVFGKGF